MKMSILMPVRNAQPYLKDCLQSIVNQSGIEWELIVVNDHSTDDSWSLLQDISANDQVTVIQNSGTGIIPALQLALASSNGEYITRMDADDIMPSSRLEKMSNLLSKSRPKTIVTGLVSYFSAMEVSQGYKTYEEWLNRINQTGRQWENIYRECVIASPNWLMRKEDLLAAGGFDNITYPEDYHLSLRWYQHGFQIKTVPEITLFWREHPERTSRSSPHYQQPAFFDLKIREFVRFDYAGGTLVLWGRNPKTKLTADILNELGIHFIQLDLGNYHHIRSLKNPQVLVGVYPKEKERLRMESYLAENGLNEGQSWWYL